MGLTWTAHAAEIPDPERPASLTAPIEGGKAVFSQLMPGLFVVPQKEADASDGFTAIHPFLISLPRWDGEQYVYDLTAKPKVSLEPKPTEPPTEPPDPWLPQTGQTNWPVLWWASFRLRLMLLYSAA